MKVMLPIPDSKLPTKAQCIHERLFEMATALGPNAKLPTVQQLRRELNVSLTTLDSVLKQLENQSVIFRKQGSGIFVSPRLHQKCVGLVCDPAFFSPGTSPFWQQMIEGARSRASQGGEAFRFYLAMGSSDGKLPVHDDLAEDVKAQRIQGVLFIGNNDHAQAWLKQHQVPSVVFAGRGDYRVEINIGQLINLAGQWLLDNGCQRLALLCPWEIKGNPPLKQINGTSEGPDVAAFREFLCAAGVPIYPELIWDARALGGRGVPVPDSHQEQGYQAAMHLCGSSHAAPDGIISTDDMMTRGVLVALRKLGLKPRHDLEIVSHTNRGSTMLNGEEENITFVEVDPAEMVAQMFSLLEMLMDNKTPAQNFTLVRAYYRK